MGDISSHFRIRVVKQEQGQRRSSPIWSVSSVLRSTPIISARKLVGHIHYFTKETALATLKDTGYDVIDYFYTSGAVELKNKSMKTNCLKIPRKLLYLLNKDLAVRLLGGFSLLVLAK